MNDLDLFIAGGVVTFLAAAGAVASTLHQVGARPNERVEPPTPEVPQGQPVTPVASAPKADG